VSMEREERDKCLETPPPAPESQGGLGELGYSVAVAIVGGLRGSAQVQVRVRDPFG